MSEIGDAAKTRYARAAIELGPESTCDCGCCSSTSYAPGELKEVGLSEGLSLGCGNPTALAQLEPGEVVLDLGSGAGLDVLLSARRVSPGGHAYGVDMTDEMIELANQNRDKAGVSNATFLKGSIESIPLPDGSVDVVISNCVINLAEDKLGVMKEAFRVLRAGGRFAVADMVEVEPLSPATKKRLDSWVGCVSGTIPVAEYRAALEAAGFSEIEFDVQTTQALEDVGKVGSAYIRARKR